MKVACIQMNISLCSKQENLERALSLAEKAVSEGAELLVFPEVFSTGFCYESIGKVAESASGPTLKALRSFSKENGCILAGSIIEKMENENKEKMNPPKKAGRIGPSPGSAEKPALAEYRAGCRAESLSQYPAQYNLGFCIEAGDLVGTHRKVQLYGLEKEYFAPGEEIAPIRLQKHGLSIGLIVCNELRYPEVARKLALWGADLLVSAADIPDFYLYPWRIMSLSRAIENQLPHIACNRVGKDRYSFYPGGSFIADGWGRILAEAGSGECVLLGEIDFEEAKKIRQAGSILEDRRPDLY